MDMDKTIRSFALSEFNSFPNISFVQGVHGIRRKLGMNKLEDSIIEDAFQRFKIANVLPINEDVSTERFLFNVFAAYLDLKFLVNSSRKLREMKPEWISKSMAQSERITVCSLTSGRSISVVDHFRGEFRDFPIKNMPTDIKFGNSIRTKIINNEYVLQIFKDTNYRHNYLCLLKLDLANKRVNFLDRVQLNIFYCHISLDELNPTRFIVDHSITGFRLGRVNENKIVFERNVGGVFRRAKFNQFVGDTVYGFLRRLTEDRIGIEFRYFQKNLSTGAFSTSESKLPFKENFNHLLPGQGRMKTKVCAYHWSGDKFFLAENNKKLFLVHIFDKEKQKWDQINMCGCSMAKDLYFDGNFLTIGCVRNSNQIQTLRFPLGKPDTLNNIVWFKIKRLITLFGSEIYNDIEDVYRATQIPINFNLTKI